MKGRTVCVIFQKLDEASYRFEEKVIEHQQMKGRTVCVILKNDSLMSLSLCHHDNIGSDFHITLDNMKFIQVNFIQSYREMKFGGNSQTCITL